MQKLKDEQLFWNRNISIERSVSVFFGQNQMAAYHLSDKLFSEAG